ncbi:Ribosomal RNA small subunit methyltransferase E [Buchnera aphidicola (Periphyllus testudinaceus)]
MKRMPRIYINDEIKVNKEISITDEKKHYLFSVMRIKIKDKINIFNNTNYVFTAKIINLKKKKVIVRIINKKKKDNESFLKINLGQSISRNKSMSWIIQKSSELGVHSITPLICKNSYLKYNKNSIIKKIKKWKKISISASEQCERNLITKILYPKKLKNWINSLNSGKKIIFTPNKISNKIKTLKKNFNIINILIGSEKGFSKKEIKLCLKNKFIHMNLGNRILRTETACLTAISILQYKYGDLNIFN